MEYVGEIVDQEQFESRTRKYAEGGQVHFYFMTLQSDRIIDATRKGNLSRFMNHSCNPNCATQKWIVNGRLRIGLFALRVIRAGTELTFDYKFIRFGGAAQKCLCGEVNCKGFIGVEQKDASVRNSVAVSQEEADAQELRLKYDGTMGAASSQEIAEITKLLLRPDHEADDVIKLLRTLQLTKDVHLRRRFLDLHGFQIISIILGQYWRNITVVEHALRLLELFPASNRNAVEDTHLLERLERLLTREDLGQDLLRLANKILETWSGLERIFRIPKSTSNLAIESPTEPALVVAPPNGNAHHHLQSGYSLNGGDDQHPRRSRWSAAASTTNDASDAGQQLPLGWKSAQTEDGRPYYYHEVTNQTQWNRPRIPGPERKDEERRQYPFNHHKDYRLREAATTTTGQNWDRDDYRRPNRSVRQSQPEKLSAVSTDNQTEEERRLQEIIERARRAALTRSAGIETHGAISAHSHPPPSSSTSNVSDSNFQKRLRPVASRETELREAISELVVKYLSRWCKEQFSSSSSFKETARRLTHALTDKELRSQSTSSSDPVTLLTGHKRAKIKNYLLSYLLDHGFRVDRDKI